MTASNYPTTGKATLTMPSDNELVISRTFQAPRRLVWEALTTPEHVRNWWGPRKYQMTVCEIDLRVGGRWRFAQAGPDGMEVAFSGEYREIVPPERLVSTEGYEAFPGHEYVATVTLDEHDGVTTFTNHVVYQSKADLDAVLASGMEPGMQETYDRLDEVLASLS